MQVFGIRFAWNLITLFVAGLLQTKATLSTDKADLSALPDNKDLLLVAQKQLLEPPLIILCGLGAGWVKTFKSSIHSFSTNATYIVQKL